MMRKIFAILVCLVIVLSSVLPVAASSGYGPVYSSGDISSHPLGWESFYFEYPYEYCSFEHPFFSVASDSLDALDTSYYSYEIYQGNVSDEDENYVRFDTVNVDVGSNDLVFESSVAGFYILPWFVAVDPLTSSSKFTFGFYGSNVIYGNVIQQFAACRACTISIPAYCSLTYNFSLSLLIPQSKTQPNGNVYTELQPVTLYSGEQVIYNGSADPMLASYLPDVSFFFDSYYSKLSSDQAFIVGSSWTGTFSCSEPVTYIQSVSMSTPLFPGGYDLSQSLPDAWYDNVTTLAPASTIDSRFTEWISDALSGFWRAEFLPGISIGGIFSVCFGILFLFIVLKFFK